MDIEFAFTYNDYLIDDFMGYDEIRNEDFIDTDSWPDTWTRTWLRLEDPAVIGEIKLTVKKRFDRIALYGQWGIKYFEETIIQEWTEFSTDFTSWEFRETFYEKQKHLMYRFTPGIMLRISDRFRFGMQYPLRYFPSIKYFDYGFHHIVSPDEHFWLDWDNGKWDFHVGLTLYWPSAFTIKYSFLKYFAFEAGYRSLIPSENHDPIFLIGLNYGIAEIQILKSVNAMIFLQLCDTEYIGFTLELKL
ncbi:hypothetical protein KAI78_10330 [bacterium]|nr:hypothetical protein [bacterium]